MMVESRIRNFLLSILAVPVAGCASFSGMPKPVLNIAAATTIPSDLQPDTAIMSLKDKTLDEQRLLRNRIIAVYVSAIDARYAEFRRLLAREVRGGNLGLDVAALGLGGLGSLAKGSANELAAASTFLTGSRSSLNKELYFEKTLPALIAVMDANRFKARGAILAHLRDPVDIYPVELAYADLANYELSASIDNAVQQLTTEASKKFEAEQSLYASLTASCDPDDKTEQVWGGINNAVYRLAGHVDPDTEPTAFPGTARPQDLARVATAFTGNTYNPATTQAEADRQAVAITSAIRGTCRVDQLNALISAAQLKVE